MVEQGEDAREAFFGGGSEPAEVTDPLETFGQDMLEETMNKAFGGQAQRAGMAIFAVTIGESDGVAVISHDAFGAERRAVNISGQVFKGRFTAAHGLDIGDPFQGPDTPGNLNEERGMIFL